MTAKNKLFTVLKQNFVDAFNKVLKNIMLLYIFESSTISYQTLVIIKSPSYIELRNLQRCTKKQLFEPNPNPNPEPLWFNRFMYFFRTRTRTQFSAVQSCYLMTHDIILILQ